MPELDAQPMQIIEQRGPVGQGFKRVPDPPCIVQSVADLAEVSRCPATRNHSPERSPDIGHGAQGFAQAGAVERVAMGILAHPGGV